MQIIAGDCVREMAALVSKGIAVDAIVTDPPYHLAPHVIGQMQQGRDGAYKRLNRGFMGKAWDGGDIAFRPETWAAIGAALKPGGYLLAFGGTRTHHRIWSAIEDAGFVIQDTIMWLYGQGFPKGRTQLKPAFEPICVAYKPCGKRELQIDECRVAITDKGGKWGNGKSSGSCWSPGRTNGGSEPEGARHELGRWPANVCHDGSDEVMEAFAAFGESTSRSGTRNNHNQGHDGWSGSFRQGPLNSPHNDAGTAARFFYCAKASKADRAGSKHPTVKPIALMRWLVRLVTPPKGTVLDPFAGSGTIAAAAIAEGRNAILIEREAEYIADIRRRVDAIGRAAA